MFFEIIKGLFALDSVAAGEDIQGRIPVFGPGVDGEMRFGHDHDPADSVGWEKMKKRPDNGSPGKSDRFDQVFSHGLQIGYNPAVTIKQLDYQMLAQPVHQVSPAKKRFCIKKP
jgi:hypothetical protein